MNASVLGKTILVKDSASKNAPSLMPDASAKAPSSKVIVSTLLLLTANLPIC
jgi:hypothetical protein